MIKVLLVIFVILAILFLVGGGYFLGLTFPMNGAAPAVSNQPSASLTPSISPSVSPSPSSLPSYMSDQSTGDGPQLGDELGPNDAQRAIEKAIESNNFDKIEPNLADKVALIIYASSCCEATSDTKEIIDFISGKAKSGKAPWAFNPPDAKYSDIEESSDFFAVDKEGRTLAFKLDDNHKLKSVTFYADYKLAGN
jgi:hypothetical protein